MDCRIKYELPNDTRFFGNIPLWLLKNVFFSQTRYCEPCKEALKRIRSNGKNVYDPIIDIKDIKERTLTRLTCKNMSSIDLVEILKCSIDSKAKNCNLVWEQVFDLNLCKKEEFEILVPIEKKG